LRKRSQRGSLFFAEKKKFFTNNHLAAVVKEALSEATLIHSDVFEFFDGDMLAPETKHYFAVHSIERCTHTCKLRSSSVELQKA
jgi:hypothetical protein